MNVSDKYKKFIVELIFSNGTFYSVWGTDEKENDLFFTINNKIALSNKILLIKEVLNNENLLFDKHNFMLWLNENNFDKAYTTIDLRSLIMLDAVNINEPLFCNQVLNSLNIIQDSFNQLNENELLKIYYDERIVSFKEYLNNIILWGEKQTYSDLTDELKLLLEKIYTEFVLRTIII